VKTILRRFQSKIQYKIIFPFLIITVAILIIGVGIAFTIVSKSQQENFNTELLELTRNASNEIVDQERSNLQFLIEVVFAPANPREDKLSVIEALRLSNPTELYRSVEPYFRKGVRTPGIQVDRLIVFNTNGVSLLDMERNFDDLTSTTPITNPSLDFSQSNLVDKIRSENKDEHGDKFTEIVDMPNAAGGSKRYFATVAPVRYIDEAGREQLLGGVMVAMELDRLINGVLGQVFRVTEESAQHQNILTFFTSNGIPIASTFTPDKGLETLQIEEDVMAQIRGNTLQMQNATVHVMQLSGREYGALYTPLIVRQEQVGVLGFLRDRNVMLEALNHARTPIIITTMVLALVNVLLGWFIAHNIVSPVQELVTTAHEVMQGNFYRRSTISTLDEIGDLSIAFNRMTETLVDLIAQVRAESSRRAAIVESITDGIVVCDIEGNVESINPATYHILGLHERALLPGRFQDFPLSLVDEALFGSKDNNMYKIGSFYVRLTSAPIETEHGTYQGNVYVLQDMTSEVNVDRAKTGFIATISHELRTPLTSMRGNIDMLTHQIVGPLNEQQLPMMQTIGQQVKNMGRLVENMVAIAGLDSGDTAIEPETVPLKPIIDKGLWPFRKQLKQKKLTLKVDLPPDIPDVQADPIQLRNVMKQLVENAATYTEEGGITIRAYQEGNFVHIDVADTGCGIPEEMKERVFERFVRGDGDSSNDRSDRGIGLGLAIVKHVIEQHGGRVWVTSTPGEGSTFSFSLRCAYEETQDPEKQPTAEAA
jgi:signal transduction histidine kinase